MPFLFSLQQTQGEILELLGSQAKRVLVPTSLTVVPIYGEPMQAGAPINDHDLSVIKHLVNIFREPITLLAHSEIEVILKKEMPALL